MGDVSTATVLSHKFLLIVLVPPRGKCCPFFLFFVFFSVFGPVYFAVFCRSSFLRVAFWKNFGSELLFLGGCVGLVFFGGFLLMFLLYFLAFRSRNCLEKFY